MKVYNHGSYGKGTLIVTPANLPSGKTNLKDGKTNSEWIDRNSGNPLSFTIKFAKGVAEVEDNLGQLLCDEKLAYSAPFLQPRGPGILYGRRATDAAPIGADVELAVSRLTA